MNETVSVPRLQRHKPQSGLWTALFLLVSVGFMAYASGCGGDQDTGTTDAASRPNKNGIIIFRPRFKSDSVTIGTMHTPEQRLLGELLAQTYETAGWGVVNRRFDLSSPEEARRELRGGRISAFPQYAAQTLVSLFGYPESRVPANQSPSIFLAREELNKEGLNNVAVPTGAPVFPYAKAVVMLSSTATDLKLESISDLEDKAANLTLYGPPDCARSPRCLPALEKTYGLRFKSFHPTAENRLYPTLEAGEAKLVVARTTDPELSGETKFATLDDDEHAFPITRISMVTRTGLTQKWFPDFSKWPYEVIRSLTLDRFRTLLSEVELEGVPPAKVAASYLKATGFVE